MKTLTQVNAKAKYTFVPSEVGSNRPEVQTRMVRCISTWSFIEALTAHIVAFSLKGDMRVAVEMYLAITSATASNAALKTAVRVGLDRKYAELFNAIWILGGELVGERHKLAHWTLGYSADVPNALLIMDPKEGVKRGAHNISIGRLPQIGRFTPRPINKIRVLSIEYLDGLIEALDAQLARVHRFLNLLEMQESETPKASLIQRRYRQLCNEPQIRQALAQMRGAPAKKAAPTPRRRKVPRGST
jgi:hypothetical protein